MNLQFLFLVFDRPTTISGPSFCFSTTKIPTELFLGWVELSNPSCKDRVAYEGKSLDKTFFFGDSPLYLIQTYSFNEPATFAFTLLRPYFIPSIAPPSYDGGAAGYNTLSPRPSRVCGSFYLLPKSGRLSACNVGYLSTNYEYTVHAYHPAILTTHAKANLDS